MALVVADRVKETTQTTGSGAYVLDGAVTGFRSFSAAVGNGNQSYYTAVLGSSWEVGIGTVTTGATPTISRLEILASTNGGAIISWPAGVKDIFLALPAAIVRNPIAQTIFASSGVWTRPNRLRKVVVEVQAGGGGGGGTASTGTHGFAAAAGGAGGGYSRKLIDATALGATETVTVGSGGAGGLLGANTGQTGGTSSFGSHCQALGGEGGEGCVNLTTSQWILSGLGGSASGGDINIPGESGEPGMNLAYGDVALDEFLFQGGRGGASQLGRHDRRNKLTADGSDGSGYGSGGGGGASSAGGAGRVGGDGAPGAVIVWEY